MEEILLKIIEHQEAFLGAIAERLKTFDQTSELNSFLYSRWYQAFNNAKSRFDLMKHCSSLIMSDRLEEAQQMRQTSFVGDNRKIKRLLVCHLALIDRPSDAFFQSLSSSSYEMIKLIYLLDGAEEEIDYIASLIASFPYIEPLEKEPESSLWGDMLKIAGGAVGGYFLRGALDEKK